MPEAERAAPEVHNFTAAAANSLVQSELLPQVQQKDRARDENDWPTTRDAFVDDPPHPLPPPEPPPGASVDHTSARLLSAASLTPRLSTPTLYAPVAAATAHAKPSQRGYAIDDDPPRPLPPPEPPPGEPADHTSVHLLSAASPTPRLSTPTMYPPVAAATAHAKPSQRGCTIDCPLWCFIRSLPPPVPFTAENTTIPITVVPVSPSPDYSSQPWDALRREEVSQPRRHHRGARRGGTQGGATARPTSPMGEG